MLKYIFGFIIVLATLIVAITVGANNNQTITFNYIFAQSEFKLSTLVAILFGLGLILGWLITAFFYLKLKLKNITLNRQIKRKIQQINQLTESRNKV